MNPSDELIGVIRTPDDSPELVGKLSLTDELPELVGELIPNKACVFGQLYTHPE